MGEGIFLKLVDFCLYRNVEINAREFGGEQAQTLVFYDHACPLCRYEMAHLKKLDKHGRLEQIDITSADFAAEAWSLNLEDLNSALHVLTPAGEWLVGMPAVRHVYRQVGMGWLMILTELPVVSGLLDAAYLRFASSRMKGSRWFGMGLNHPGCTDDVCELKAHAKRRAV
jgi:predicted DCC family thiol-disulfide oxidoreductase YuxK